MPGLQPDFMVRPVAGVFGTRALAETELDKPLDLLITARDPAQEPGTRVPWVRGCCGDLYGAHESYDPATVRFAPA